MNILNLKSNCVMCSAHKKAMSLDLSLSYMHKEYIKTILLNEINNKQLRSNRSRKELQASNYKYPLSKLCGCCRDSKYRSMRIKESEVLNNICILLNYAITNNINLKNIQNLKNSCRGNYSSLYRSIDNYERKIILT